ncbi:hypothetical protein Hte_010277 [Hypoxylon texense]
MSQNHAAAPSRTTTNTMPTFEVVSQDNKIHVVPIADNDTLATLKKTIRNELGLDEEFDIKIPGPNSSISADEAKLLARLRQGATMHVTIHGGVYIEGGQVRDQAANNISSGKDGTKIYENETTDKAKQKNVRAMIGGYAGETSVQIYKNNAKGDSFQTNMVVTSLDSTFFGQV